MNKVLVLLYGLLAYGVFFATNLYAIGFAGNIGVPKTIDSGLSQPLLRAVPVNLLLLGLFGLQHSVMARQSVKRAWQRILPPVLERSTYVLLSSLILDLLFWQWQSIRSPIWKVDARGAVVTLNAAFWLGWGLAIVSTFQIDHFELFGVKQVFAYFTGKDYPQPPFKTPLLYRFVRHPLYLGFLLAFWSTPAMTLGHLLFATGMTGYIFIGTYFEEKDLLKFHPEYADYRGRVAMIIPFLKGRKPPLESGKEPA